MVKLLPEELSALDSWRSKHPEKPNRPEAIRLMIASCTNDAPFPIARPPKAIPPEDRQGFKGTVGGTRKVYQGYSRAAAPTNWDGSPIQQSRARPKSKPK